MMMLSRLTLIISAGSALVISAWAALMILAINYLAMLDLAGVICTNQNCVLLSEGLKPYCRSQDYKPREIQPDRFCRERSDDRSGSA